MKEKLLRLFHTPIEFISEAFVENSDSCAAGRRAMMYSTTCLNLMNSLVAGTFFTALMLAMGASDVYIGYVTVATTFCGFSQFLSPLVWEKIPVRKPLLLFSRILYHLLNIVLIGLIPILPIPDSAKLVSFIVTIIVLNLINYIAAPGITAWHMQSLPFAKRLNYSTVTNLIGVLTNVISAFLASMFFDAFTAEGLTLSGLTPTLTAILILRGVALVAGVLEVIFYAKIKEFPYEVDNNTRGGLKLLILPLKNKAFMMTIIIPVLWTFIGSIIGGFFNIYIIDHVHMSYTLISMGGIVSTPLILLMTPLWAAGLKRKPWLRMLSIALLGYSCAYMTNAFITPSTLYCYILCIVIGNIFQPCIDIVRGNIIYLRMPDTNRTAYISLNAILLQVASLLGSYVGTLFVQYTDGLSVRLFGFDMCNLQLVNVISACLGVCLAVYTFIYSIREEKK